MKTFISMACVVFVCVGCASWFTERVDRKDREIAVLEEKKSEATPEESAAINAEIAAKRADRDLAMQGALQEQANRQAFLMAMIGLGVAGLKTAAGMAAKGV